MSIKTICAGSLLAALLIVAPAQAETKCEIQQKQLVKASEGLLYPSESDYPFTKFSSSGISSLPTPEEFAAIVGRSGEPATVANFDTLFQRLENPDPLDPVAVKNAKQFEKLEKEFRANYDQLAVYRVGEISVQVYIVGINACGLSGLQTISIET